jgi:hypothetical protein
MISKLPDTRPELRSRPSHHEPRTPDDAKRLLAPLVAICGEQISDYRPRIEVLVTNLIPNRRFVKPDSGDGRPVARVHMPLPNPTIPWGSLREMQ